jgi:hypothetical protein
MAVAAFVALTLGVGAFYSVDARPASPESSASAAAARTTCAPKHHVKKTLLGLNRFGSQGFGHVPVVRNWDYNTPGPLSASWAGQTRDVPRKTAMVISFRFPPQQVNAGQWDSQIKGFFKHAPKHRMVFWNYYHEPETPVKAHEFTPYQFRKAFRRIDRLSKPYCRSNLLPTLILQGWTADPHSGSNGLWHSWKDFYPGKRYVSVVAWDPYNSATHVPRSYAAPRILYRTTVRASRSVHKPWAIAETGSALVPGDHGQARARWLHKVAKYSRRHHAAFVTYFNSVGHGAIDFRLLDKASAQAWRQEMSR